MTDIISTIVLIILAVIICIVLYFVFKNGMKLLINALCGVAILFVVSFLHLAPIGSLSLAQVIVCAVGGVIGAVLLIVLSFFGIVI
ncbi:MAG: sigmaK-factor processing regulatory BofA [Methanocorpusculum parvum]|nr:sigmaK-factor processing regulatory BofA [Methanocorpusculum parvum]